MVTGKGLSALPAADDGDIWFDMEGIQDSVAGTKLEYLFGACYRNELGSKAEFKDWWAHSPIEEKRAASVTQRCGFTTTPATRKLPCAVWRSSTPPEKR